MQKRLSGSKIFFENYVCLERAAASNPTQCTDAAARLTIAQEESCCTILAKISFKSKVGAAEIRRCITQAKWIINHLSSQLDIVIRKKVYSWS